MEVEDRLERFRPVGPPSNLRGRVLAGAGRSAAGRGARGLGWWLPLGAVAAILLFSTLASRERAHAVGDPSTDDRTRHSLIGVMADKLSGDTLLASRIVSIEFVEEPLE